MRIPIYQIDAFADRPFAGNPAAVCPLDDWLPDEVMQGIALENNLSETAFLVRQGEDGYRLRWFTPALEVALCGHATLASGYLVLNRLAPERASVAFDTLSGRLEVARDGALLRMDLPADPARPIEAPDGLVAALGRTPVEIHQASYLMAVYESEAEIRTLAPDIGALGQIGPGNVIVTALGDAVDFVSRFFAPGAGIPEDPVTGSAHCTLMPYWAARLGRDKLEARQISARGGRLVCELAGERVHLSGACAFYMEGTIELPG
jgi:PhzF family phenazine biosynthesis protein